MTYLLPAIASGAPTLDIVHCVDALTLLRALPDASIDCVVTSPPYYALRDYGCDGQIGLEPSPTEYIRRMMEVFQQVQRVLKPSGTCWVNLGDNYATNTHMNNGTSTGVVALKPGQNETLRTLKMPKWDRPEKSLLMIPERFAIAMQDDNWILRNKIVWHKPAAMPESATDRCTRAYEMIYFFTKEPRYWSNFDAIREPASATNTRGNRNAFRGAGAYAQKQAFHNSVHIQNAVTGNADIPNESRIARDVWSFASSGNSEQHYAGYPTELPQRCILAGCPVGGVVLDMFMGSGTTALTARRLGRHFIGGDLNPEYVQMSRRRLAQSDPYQHRVVGDMKQLSMFAGALP